MNFHEDFEFLVKEIVGVPNKSLLHFVVGFGGMDVQNIFLARHAYGRYPRAVRTYVRTYVCTHVRVYVRTYDIYVKRCFLMVQTLCVVKAPY